MEYEKEYQSLLLDSSRMKKFITTGKEGRRIFTVLNSNIKTLKTLGEYIHTMYSQTTYYAAYKQMNERVRVYNFRSIENHTETRSITRSDIILSAGKRFGGYDHAFVTLLLYLLLLDIGKDSSETVKNAKEFIYSMPVFFRRRLLDYSKQIAMAERSAFPCDNIYLEMVVLYGDESLYRAFLQHVQKQYPDEKEITELFVSETSVNTSPISKRIANFQSSALKKDALYTTIFYILDQYVRRCKMRGLRTGKKTVDAGVFLNEFLDYFSDAFEGSLDWLGKIGKSEDIDTLKAFITNYFTDEQKKEIYTCIQNAFGLHTPIP